MSRQEDFLIYCTEQYKSAKELTGKQIAELFTQYSVWDDIYSCFEALHTTTANNIVDDIDRTYYGSKHGMGQNSFPLFFSLRWLTFLPSKQLYMQKNTRFPEETGYDFGTSGDTELFEKPSNINGVGTFGQHFFLF